MSNPYAPPDPTSSPVPPGPDQQSGDSGKPPDKVGRPQKPPPTPEQLAAVSRSVLRFGLFMLAAVLTMQVPLPWQLASIAFAVAAIVVGVRALVRVLKDQVRGMIVVLLAFGLALSGMLLVTSVSTLALWDEQMARQDCLRSAITVAAQDRCEGAYQQAIEERLGTWN